MATEQLLGLHSMIIDLEIDNADKTKAIVRFSNIFFRLRCRTTTWNGLIYCHGFLEDVITKQRYSKSFIIIIIIIIIIMSIPCRLRQDVQPGS